MQRFGGVPLELKFGVRMLVKHPGLTLVAGLAMAFAVCVGAVTFAMVSQVLHPSLPFPDGDRVVQLRNWDAAAGRTEPRALRDFSAWRAGLRSVTDLGAYRDLSRNVVAPDGNASPLQVAEITANAFRMAPAAPVVGRALAPSDERPGAPPVIVLGHDVWRERFGADPAVVGRSVRLDEAFVTVVGVMPAGYGFPVSHDAWTPLPSNVVEQPPREGPPVTIFGRLAPGVSLAEAQVELSVVGARTAAELPATHEQLRPQVVSYVRADADPAPEGPMILYSVVGFGVLLLVLICGNVAMLMFARAATRQSELVVRSALGASRRRVIGQLFAEALVLGAGATVVGLAAAQLALRHWGVTFLEENMGRLPFWYDVRLTPGTVVYALGLTLLGAAIAGVLPAVKVMNGLGSRLRAGTAGGGGLRFGGVWTVVIVTQVALTVAFPALAWFERRKLEEIRAFPAGFASEDYLAAFLAMAGDSADRRVAAIERLRQRVAAEPGVRGVTFVDRLPRDYHVERYVELDEPPAPASATAPAPLREVSTARIDPSYFAVLQSPVVAGRGFTAADLAPGANVVIVDRSFVDQVLQGRNAVGRRVRFAREQRGGPLADEERPWYQIVGVVNELGMGAPTQSGRAAGFYLPEVPGRTGGVEILVHAQGDPLVLGNRLRALATAVDPALRLSSVQRVDQVTSPILWILGMWLKVTLVLTGVALLLALAGIYAVLSFTVARRTREIGVRVALGSDRRRVVAAVFRRPLAQVGAGVALGGTLVGVVALALAGGGLAARHVALLVAYAAGMLGVCLLACVVPTRRALRVEPTIALRAE
ncbi:ABC transporter permease [Roseisolibacter sp. H3M3-2]|uniref:ABC transporter permease n=1 Tax=Roseisolibacter sp. H3M3-2 TaxID=3031323 RepID=UPI0023DA286C|nr:ABC transporter permease [Roseisolibacter sp. H3M3-2]MDF1501577.1 ABC transporter permease [Roseisolibacter sp. H3M3-2]